MKPKIKFNRTIKIYRTDIEKMKDQIGRRACNYLNVYFYYKESGIHRTNKMGGEYISDADVYREFNNAIKMLKELDAMLANESFDFIYVDADEWFDEWYIQEHIDEWVIDAYYMFPNSDEVDEIFERLKGTYKYIINDLFGFFRFCPVDRNVVIA